MDNLKIQIMHLSKLRREEAKQQKSLANEKIVKDGFFKALEFEERCPSIDMITTTTTTATTTTTTAVAARSLENQHHHQSSSSLHQFEPQAGGSLTTTSSRKQSQEQFKNHSNHNIILLQLKNRSDPVFEINGVLPILEFLKIKVIIFFFQ